MSHRRHRPLSRRIQKKAKTFWRKYWTIAVTIVFAFLTAFYIIPSLYKFFTETE